MSFITLEETKQFLSISSPNQDSALQPLVDGINGLFLELIDANYVPTATVGANSTSGSYSVVAHTEGSTSTIPLDLLSLMQGGNTPIIGVNEIVFLPESGSFDKQVIPTDYYTISSKQATILPLAPTGEYEVSVMTVIANTALSTIKTAALQLCRHYYKDEYKQTQSSGTQSVSYTPSVGNMPKHIRLLIEPYRGL